jgi:hypothetical protein
MKSKLIIPGMVLFEQKIKDLPLLREARKVLLFGRKHKITVKKETVKKAKKTDKILSGLSDEMKKLMGF